MKKVFLTVVLVAGAISIPAAHADAVKDIKDNPGMAVGAGAGAVLFGPAGAVVGAGIGAVTDNIAREVGNLFRW